MTVSFHPAAAGADSGLLQITDSSGSNPSVTLTGTGVQVQINTSSPVNFGTVLVGSTGTQNLTITNITNTAIGTTITVPSPYTITANSCFTVVANSYCTVTLAFTPPYRNTFLATGVIVQSTGITTTFSLSGTGASPAPAASLTPATGGLVRSSSTSRPATRSPFQHRYRQRQHYKP